MTDWGDFNDTQDEQEREFDTRSIYIDTKLDELHDKLDQNIRTHGRVGEYHPSQLYDMCPIEQYFFRKDPLPQLENLGLPTRRVMAAGSNAHDYFQQYELGQAGLLYGVWECPACDWKTDDFEPMPKKCEKCDCPWIRFKETRIHVEEYNIVGHYDGLLKVDGDFYTLEMKSKTKDRFGKIVKPDRREIFQASIYDKYNIADTKGIVFGYICRERYYFKTVFVDRDEKAVAQAIERIELIEESLEKDTVPLNINPTCRRCAKCDSQRAKACPYNKECWSIV